MFDPGQSKSCGYATKRTRFTPAVNGGILSLLKDSVTAFVVESGNPFFDPATVDIDDDRRIKEIHRRPALLSPGSTARYRQ